jgi:glycosyltransferase involved in cell wall biosynthesis
MNITLGHHRPIIASRVSSFSDILPSSAVFKTGSVSDLYTVLNRALNDDDFNRELSECTRDIAEDRSWKKIAQTTADLYFTLLKKQNS